MRICHRYEASDLHVNPALAHLLSRVVPTGIPTALALQLLDTSWFVRRVVLDRWFLHVRDVPFACV